MSDLNLKSTGDLKKKVINKKRKKQRSVSVAILEKAKMLDKQDST